MTVYNPIKQEDVQKRINGNKKENIENHLLITLKSLQVYAAAAFKFGKESEAAKDALYARKEFVRILKEERKLFKFLLNNLHLVDLNAASEVINMLDEVRDDTVRYYNEVLNGIEKAAVERDEKLATRAPRDFSTLTETRNFREEVVGLLEDTYTVRKYLNLPEEFWSFIAGKCSTIEMTHDDADAMAFVNPIYDKDGNIASLRMTAPKPTDLYTALVAIQTYIKAFYVYQAIGQPNFLNDEYTINKAQLNYVKYLGQKATHTIK